MVSYRRKQEDNRRLKKTYAQTKNAYGNGVYFDENKGRYIRVYSPRSAKFFRKQSNKRVRKSNFSMRVGEYLKQYDYWWQIW